MGRKKGFGSYRPSCSVGTTGTRVKRGGSSSCYPEVAAEADEELRYLLRKRRWALDDLHQAQGRKDCFRCSKETLAELREKVEEADAAIVKRRNELDRGKGRG